VNGAGADAADRDLPRSRVPWLRRGMSEGSRVRARTSRVILLVLIALFRLAPGSTAADALPAEAEALRRGPAALPGILAHVDAQDPDTRIRARALATRIVLDYYEAHAPEGMRLVAGSVSVSARGASCERGFYLAVHEVTVAEFREFARTGSLPDHWKEGAAGLPAANVSLVEARAFAESKGARLPTLAELTLAACGGGRLRYPWGDRFDPARVNSRESARGCAEPVGRRAGGLSVEGIADLLGNVAEWTETPADRRRFVVAGGSYRGYAERAPFATYRLEPSSRLHDVGFRLAKSLPPLLTRAPE